jgi:hypothetical protein
VVLRRLQTAERSNGWRCVPSSPERLNFGPFGGGIIYFKWICSWDTGRSWSGRVTGPRQHLSRRMDYTTLRWCRWDCARRWQRSKGWWRYCWVALNGPLVWSIWTTSLFIQGPSTSIC